MTENEKRVLEFAGALGLSASEFTACCNEIPTITSIILALAVKLQAFAEVKDASAAARMIAFANSTIDGRIAKALAKPVSELPSLGGHMKLDGILTNTRKEP